MSSAHSAAQRGPNAAQEDAFSSKTSSKYSIERGSPSVILGVLLVLAGLASALCGGAQVFQVNPISPQGEFAGLAAGGGSVYLAEEVNNSFGLLKSTDHGLSWSLLPLPTPKVVTGVSWGYAALAADQHDVLFVSATTNSCSRGLNTTILIDASDDDGSSWVVTALELGIQVGSLGASVSNGLAAVEWSAHRIAPFSCFESPQDLAQVTVSPDAGNTWGTVQNITPSTGSVLASADIALAASDVGIIAGVEQYAANSSLYQLVLYRYAGGNSPGFEPLPEPAQLAPANWALLGSSSTPGFLLTPASLTPIGQTEGLSIPFPQLQANDELAFDELPLVSALGVVNTHVIDVAVTIPDQVGVDCWRINIDTAAVTHSCQVDFQGSLYPTSTTRSVVGLVDGGEWWVALFGATYSPGDGGGVVAGTTATGAYSSAAQTGQAYTYNGASTLLPLLTELGALLLVVGLAILLIHRRALRKKKVDPRASSPAPDPKDPRQKLRTMLQRARRDYRIVLYCWLGVWSPLLLLVFFPSGTTASMLIWPALLIGASAGTILTIPFDIRMRRHLASWQRPGLLDTIFHSGGFWTSFLGSADLDPDQKVNRTAATGVLLNTSRVVGGLLVLAMLASIPYVGFGSSPPLGLLSPLAWVLVGLIVVFELLRAVYHMRLATTTVHGESGWEETELSTGGRRRGVVGAALLPWNPLVGGLLGLLFQPLLPGGPYVLVWGFLLVNLLAAGLLLGAFGASPWSRED